LSNNAEGNPLFLLVDTFLGFAQNSFGKRQTATCSYSKEFCTNLKNVSTNRKKDCSGTHCLQKSFANSKAFGVKPLKTYKFDIILPGELKK
jgi:hypothetical protein